MLLRVHGDDFTVGRGEEYSGCRRNRAIGVSEKVYHEAGKGQQKPPNQRHHRQTDDCHSQHRYNERPSLARDGQAHSDYIPPLRSQLIIWRRRAPTTSMGCSASRLVMALKTGRLALFSMIHSRANSPDWISLSSFFMASRVSWVITRRPRVISPY